MGGNAVKDYERTGNNKVKPMLGLLKHNATTKYDNDSIALPYDYQRLITCTRIY